MLALLAAALLSVQNSEAGLDCASAVTNVQIDECRGVELEQETARMRAYLDAALTRLREESGAADGLIVEITDSQAAWAAYADSACNAVHTHWRDGSIRQSMFLACKTDLTRERTHHLWREYLTFVDSTPPILPEPALPGA
ncbi:lysozyme inhibitor LprI family protein [Brevundimonas sp. PAMC22021]|uniref:lysozyme inhibitor LprI family protein n=1 Tax=Brevundimonas sp. PAMC22021 TaxID=2861285 RepID=UPI001C63122E|nr:lysozyme inhibitor LprI family protein [Brevundimonas sp. PAMC22021]QYF85797.1 lysozyme inhibitor LprI family protein [Brevundimonas sp. PAMC22021]